MKRFIENYQSESFDILIIGGGISGACIAYEAATRGLKVALVEKGDFGAATSAATSKMIHGGLRYLAKMELSLVRESLRERRILSNIAPNFVQPIPFLLSYYDRDKAGGGLLKIGMLLYELLSFDKGWLKDKSKKMPLHQTISREKVISAIPKANSKGLKGAHLYYDCVNHFPERFTLAFLKSAVKHGAKIANYTKMEDFILEQNADGQQVVKGVQVTDLLHQKQHQLNANLVINCAGPWADLVLNKIKKPKTHKQLRRSEGIHIITKKLVDKYIFSGATKTGKHYFIVPYRNHALIGTTDKEYIGHPNEWKVTKSAITELLDTVNESFGNGEKIRYEDIVYAYGGLRPLVASEKEDTYNASRKYELTDLSADGIEGLIGVEGGKWTTSRGLAEIVIDKAFKKLNITSKKSSTATNYVIGSEIENLATFTKEKQVQYPNYSEAQIEYLVKSYGTEIDAVMELTAQNPAWQKSITADGENLGQIVYAIRNEMAFTLSDLLLRRTGIGLLGHPGEEKLAEIATLAAKELNWSEEKKQQEIKTINQLLQLPL